MNNQLDINLTALLGNDAKAQDAEMCKLVLRVANQRGLYALSYTAFPADSNCRAFVSISEQDNTTISRSEICYPEETT